MSLVEGPPTPSGNHLDVQHTIVAGSLSGGLSHISETATVARSVVEGGAPGPNVIDADPRFWGNADFHLLPDSPARVRALGQSVRAGYYRFDPDWCGQNCDGDLGLPNCTAAPNSTGVPARLTALGSLDPQRDRLVLNARDLPSNTFGMLITGRTAGFTPMAGGQGNLCLGGQILRLPGQHRSGNNGSISARPVLSNFPAGMMVQSGESWLFQVWFRDNLAGTPTSNLTPSLLIQY